MVLRRAPIRLALAASFLALVLIPAAAPGTVTEQRRRLPPPAECESEIEGKWKAHQFDARFAVWHVFELEVHGVEGDKEQLTGTIKVRVWRGQAADEEPGPCRGQTHYTATMTAKGTHKNGEIHFWGTKFKLDEVLCGRYGSYNLDHFSGTVDKELQEFQSVNNDGGNAVNSPTVFRRIGCFDEDDPEPTIKITPPPLFPESTRSSGCSCKG